MVQSSSSPGPSTPVGRRSLGAVIQADVSSLTLSNLCLGPGGVLVALAAVLATRQGMTVTFRGRILPPDVPSQTPRGASLPTQVQVFSDPFSGGFCGDLTLHAAGGFKTVLALQAVEVTGLAVGILDQSSQTASRLSVPDVPSTDLLSAFQEYGQSAFAMAGTAGFDWAGGMTSGDQDVSLLVPPVVLTEGYRIPVGTLVGMQASLQTASRTWSGLVATYR